MFKKAIKASLLTLTVFAITFISSTVFASSPFNVNTNVKATKTNKPTKVKPKAKIQRIVVLSGQQTRGVPGRNGTITSKAITLTKDSKVISVSGNNNGFWISSAKGVVAKYYKSNDKKVVGLFLKKGTYYIYPNLKKMQNKANVSIRIK